MFGPRGGCAYCGCRKYKKQKGFTCSCGHNLQNHAEAQPTVAQQIAWQMHLGLHNLGVSSISVDICHQFL